MADGSGSEVSSWTSGDAEHGEALPVSEISRQITASVPQNDWSSCSPSNGSDITEPSASTWQDSCLPVLDSSLPSAAASAPSTATDGTCWSAAGAVASCSDASSPLVWADCDSDGVLASVQQQQQAGNTTANAQMPQSGRAFVPGRAARGNSPDGDVSSRASSGQSSAGATSGVSQESAPEAYSSGIWNSAANTPSRGNVKALTTDDKESLTPQMLKAIETTEGWGRTPVRQDTPWPLPSSMNWPHKGDPSLWCSSQNNGTAAWESWRSNNGAGSSAMIHHVPGSWSDRRASVPLDRSGAHWTAASLSRDSPSWGENADRAAGSSTALDVPPWNGNSSVNRIRSRTPGSLSAPQGCAANFTNGEGNRSSPPGVPCTIGTQGEWSSGGMKGFRTPDGRLSQPPWAEGGQGHNWNHNDNFFAAAAASRQLSQPAGRSDFTGSSMPWDQPTTQSNLSGSAAVSELSDWDQGSTLGTHTGSTAWPPSEGSGNHRISKSTHRDDSMPEWSAAGPAVAAPSRRGRYSVDAAMTGSWRNDSEIGEWARGTTGGTIHRLLPAGSKQCAINGAAAKVSGHSFTHQLPMRPHLMQKLLEMGFSKESAQKALIDNNMDLRQAIADLHRSAGGQQSVAHAPRPLLPPADASVSGGFSSSPLQMYPPGNQNAHHGNTQIGSTMTGKPFAHAPAGRQQPFTTALPSKLSRQPPNGQYMPAPVTGWSSVGANQQAMQSLQFLINLGYIPPSALAKQTNNVVIEQMMGLLSTFQALQQQVARCSSPQMAAHHWEQLDTIKQRLAALGQSLAEAGQQRLHQGPDAALSDELASLSLGQHQYMQQTQQGQSKLAQWKVPSESDTGMLSQASRAPGTKPMMTAGLSGATSADDIWSASTSSRPKLDANHNESQSVVDDLHEFIPGQMWAGSPGLTNDDGLLSSGSPLSIGGSDEASGWSSSFASISRSLSVPSAGGWSLGSNAGTAAAAPALATHGSSSVSGNADSHWSSAMPRASAAAGRPPPGLSNFSTSAKSAVGYGRRSSTSACWSPSSGTTGANGSGGRSSWDKQSSLWVVLQNVPLHIDQSRLKVLCGTHGTVTAFLPNLAAGTALVQYSSVHEAAAAQGYLHNRIIAQNTLQAQLVGDDEARSFVERATSHGVSSSVGLAMAASSAWNAAGSMPTSGAAPSAWNPDASASASAMPSLGSIVLGNLWQGGAGAGADSGSSSAGGSSSVVGGSPYPTDY